MFGSTYILMQAFHSFPLPFLNYHFPCATPYHFTFATPIVFPLTASVLPSTKNMTNMNIPRQVRLYCL